jgi:hypothetical protein
MLTDKQWDELYTASIENRKDIAWIRKGMDFHTKEIEDCRVRVNDLEVNQGVQRGKVAYLAISLTAVCTVLVNGLLWTFNYFGGSK